LLHAGVDLKGGIEAACAFGDRVQLFLLAVSLGARIAGGPAAVLFALQHERRGVAARRSKPGNGGVSMGVEDAADLIADLQQALG